MDALAQATKSVERLGRRLREAAKAAKGGGTIIVHPQIARSPEEAQAMAGDWSARVERQVMDNISEALGR